MRTTGRLLCLLATTTALTATTPPPPPTPAPAEYSAFTLPLKNNTTATAAILPTADGEAYLVYATSTGNLGSYHLIPTHQTQPPNPPPPPPTPPPPPPPPATGCALITVTSKIPADLSDPLADWLAAHHWTHAEHTVAEVARNDTPPTALHWIGRTAGHTYPYMFISAADETILWQGNPPPLATDLITILEIYASRNATRCAPRLQEPRLCPTCPTCP